MQPPKGESEATQWINLTYPDSSLMRKTKRYEDHQAYNAQAAVDAGGTTSDRSRRTRR